jgi:hypothetical protein
VATPLMEPIALTLTRQISLNFLRGRSNRGGTFCQRLLNMPTATDFRLLAKRLARRRLFGAKLTPEATILAMACAQRLY